MNLLCDTYSIILVSKNKIFLRLTTSEQQEPEWIDKYPLPRDLEIKFNTTSTSSWSGKAYSSSSGEPRYVHGVISSPGFAIDTGQGKLRSDWHSGVPIVFFTIPELQNSINWLCSKLKVYTLNFNANVQWKFRIYVLEPVLRVGNTQEKTFLNTNTQEITFLNLPPKCWLVSV